MAGGRIEKSNQTSNPVIQVSEENLELLFILVYMLFQLLMSLLYIYFTIWLDNNAHVTNDVNDEIKRKPYALNFKSLLGNTKLKFDYENYSLASRKK